MRKLFGALLILLLALLEYGECAYPHEDLFSVPPDGIQVDLPSINPVVVLRQRLVTVQSHLIGCGDEPTACLNPFDDVHLEALWERTERNANGGCAWFGHIQQAPSSELVLVVDGSNMAASITIFQRKYTVRHLRDDLYLVREVDLTSFQTSTPTARSGRLALQAVPSDFETDVLDLVNQERVAQNLRPLNWNNKLHEAARDHSEDMAANNYFSHTSLDGRTAWDRIEDAGYEWSAAGENIAAGYSTPQAVVNGWMNSAGHRQNILSSAYCDLGVGYAYNPSSTYDHYWTQDFGRRMGVVSCPSVVNQPPSASFMATPISGSSPLVVQFDASASADPDGGPLSFEWDFGDGQIGSDQMPSHTYTTAATFTVTLTVRDSGGASDSLVKMNYITAEAPPVEATDDEVVANYGRTYGLWHYDQIGGWSQLNAVGPGQMTAVDVDNDTQEELAVTFSGYGLWIYNPTSGWSQLNTIAPENMNRLNNGLALDYGVYGLWSWTQAGGWQQLNTIDPGQMVAVEIDNDTQEELAVTFSGYGLWIYNPTSGWSQLNTIVPENMIQMNNGLACDYGVYGLWSWTQTGGWQQLNTADPGQMVAVEIDNDTQEELAVTFSGYGLWLYDPTGGWSQLNTIVPENMIQMNNGLACDYGVYGLWSWTETGGWQQLNTADPGQMVAVDIDNDTQEELAATFSGYGLWIYNPTSGWSQLNTIAPDAMTPANLLN